MNSCYLCYYLFSPFQPYVSLLWPLKTLYRNSHRRRSIKKGVLENFAKFTGKLLCQSLSFYIKKETLAQVFSCKFCEIFKNASCFTEHLGTTASDYKTKAF